MRDWFNDDPACGRLIEAIKRRLKPHLVKAISDAIDSDFVEKGGMLDIVSRLVNEQMAALVKSLGENLEIRAMADGSFDVGFWDEDYVRIANIGRDVVGSDFKEGGIYTLDGRSPKNEDAVVLGWADWLEEMASILRKRVSDGEFRDEDSGSKQPLT